MEPIPSVERPDRMPDAVALPRFSEPARLVERFVDAFESGDLTAIIELLTDDARIVMPPEPVEFRGPRAITEFLRSRGFWDQDLKLVHTGANGQPDIRLLPARPTRTTVPGRRNVGAHHFTRRDLPNHALQRHRTARSLRAPEDNPTSRGPPNCLEFLDFRVLYGMHRTRWQESDRSAVDVHADRYLGRYGQAR